MSKQIVHRAYLENKPYNDIVLHLERLNGLGASNKTTIIPLNTVDTGVTEDKNGQQQRVSDVTVRGEDYLPNPEVRATRNDWYTQAWETEFGEVLFGTPTDYTSEEATVTEITDKTEDGATTTNKK